MVKVFTDAAVSSGIAAVTAIVLTDKAFIGYTTDCFHSVSTSLVGELHGIYVGLKYTLSLNIEDDIVLYTDSEYAVRTIVAGRQERWTPEVTELVTSIRELMSQAAVSLEHFEGHQTSHNPNKIADFTSKSILRNIVRGGRAYGRSSSG